MDDVAGEYGDNDHNVNVRGNIKTCTPQESELEIAIVVRLLERRFKVKVPLERAWAHLQKIEQWPTWARHIRSIELRPPGPLVSNSEGLIRLTNGISSTFRMEQLNVGTNWKWAGPFLWIKVHYDHQFSRIGLEESEIGFVLEGEGFAVRVFGRLFAAIYARNLDRAIPRLIAELETTVER